MGRVFRGNATVKKEIAASFLLSISWAFLWPDSTLCQSLYPAEYPVKQGQSTLRYPFAGGLNQAQFSHVDYDQDGQPELAVFDRSDNHLLLFRRNPGNSDFWEFVPEGDRYFPSLSSWVLFRDFDGDGHMDIFTSNPSRSGVSIYRQIPGGDSIRFEWATPLLTTAEGEAVFVASTDLPAITDLDQDGDLDLLSFEPGGFFVVAYRNFSVEQFGHADSLVFSVQTPCWGNFQESGINNEILLNQRCGNLVRGGGMHAGSTLLAFDEDSDGDQDLLVGDISHENVVFLRNNGSKSVASINEVDPGFPAYDVPVDLYLFPAMFLVDVAGTRAPDLLITPNSLNASANVGQILLYENLSPDSGWVFQYRQDDFLQEEMIDVGQAAHPVWEDIDEDGLPDLLIGNQQRTLSDGATLSGLSLYKNTGTPGAPAFTLEDPDFLTVQKQFSIPKQNFHATFGDLDNDGDRDMILGDADGEIHLWLKKPSAGGQAPFELAGARFQDIDVGQHATPQLSDIDGDGLLDLLIGAFDGKVHFYHNTGTPALPRFQKPAFSTLFDTLDISPRCCSGFSSPFWYRDNGKNYLWIGSEEQTIRWLEVTEDLQQATLRDASFSDLQLGRRLTPYAADITGDGQLDWVIGTLRGGVSVYSGRLPTFSNSEIPSMAPLRYSLKEHEIWIQSTQPSGQPLILTFFALTGQKYHQETLKGNQTLTVDTSTWPGGIFFLHYQSPSKVGALKFLVQR